MDCVEHSLKCYYGYYRIAYNGCIRPLLAGMKVRMEYVGYCPTQEGRELHTMTRFFEVTFPYSGQEVNMSRPGGCLLVLPAADDYDTSIELFGLTKECLYATT